MPDVINLFDCDKDFKALAVERINKEQQNFKGDKYGNAVYTYVANSLRDFCNQDERFAEAVVKSNRGFAECIENIMKGCGNAISDIEVYRRAAKFFFPDSEVSFIMTIKLGEFPTEKYLSQKSAVKNEPKGSQQKKPEPKQKANVEKKKDQNIIQLSLFGKV